MVDFGFFSSVVALSFPLSFHTSYNMEQWSQVATIVSVFGLGVLGVVMPFMKALFRRQQKRKEAKDKQLEDKFRDLLDEVVIEKLDTISQNQIQASESMIKLSESTQKLADKVDTIQSSVTALKTESGILKNIVMSNLSFNRSRNNINEN